VSRYLQRREGEENMLTEKVQSAVVDRLMRIISKTYVVVQSKNGPVEDEVTADKNAIAAAKLLVAIQAQWLKCQQQQSGLVGSRTSVGTAAPTELPMTDSSGYRPMDLEAITTRNPGAPGCQHGAPLSPQADCSGSGPMEQNNSRSIVGQVPQEPLNEVETDGAFDLSSSDEGLIDERLFAHSEPDEAPSDFHYTADDVIREAIRIAGHERANVSDKIDKQAGLEHVRGSLYQPALRESVVS
jgi:hypothetical protein